MVEIQDRAQSFSLQLLGPAMRGQTRAGKVDVSVVVGRFQGRLELGPQVIDIAAKSRVICLPSVSAWSGKGARQVPALWRPLHRAL